VEMARAAIKSGAAKAVLAKLVEVSRG
jgi:hypothetical protein